MTDGRTETPVAVERKILTFLVNWQVFGIDMEPLIEVREWDDPRPIPKAPPHLLGIANLRGAVLPIVDLSQRLGWSRTKITPRTCTIVVRIASQQVGFVVDRVADIVPINEAAIQPCPDIAMRERALISGLVQVPGSSGAEGSDACDTVILLNLAALDVARDFELAA